MAVATLVLFAAATCALCWFVKYLIDYMKFKKEFDSIGGPPALPIIGNALLLKSDGAEFYQEMMDQTLNEYAHTRSLRLWAGPKPYLIIYGAELVEDLLASNKMISKAEDYRFMLPWLGTGLLLSTGQKWKRRRRMLTPSFHFKILDDFMAIFNEQASVMVGRLKKKCGGDSFDICPYVTLCALDIICETAMGRKIHAQEDADSEYVRSVYRMSELIALRWKTPWKHPDWLYKFYPEYYEHQRCLKVLHGFTEQVIKERKTEYKQYCEKYGSKTVEELIAGKDSEVFGQKKRLAFMDMLLCSSEDGQPLTMEAMQEETDTFMFEGHDTTSSAISFALYNIGAHQEVQKKIQEELDALFGDSDRNVTNADLAAMKYLECTIKESLRMYATVPFFGRCMTEDSKIGHLFVKKGVTVMCATGALHRDPRVFPQPDTFDPDRFLPDNASKRRPFTYVPFSAGPRNCIGQNFAMREEKIVLASILRNFHIESMQKESELRPCGDVILRPQHGVLVKLTSRR